MSFLSRHGWSLPLLDRLVGLANAVAVIPGSLQFSSGSSAPSTAPSNANRPAQYQDIASSFTYNWNIATQTWIAVPKVYKALLTQTGTNAPIPTVVQNTIGSIVWSRFAEGTFRATLAGAFPAGKTLLFCGSARDPDGDGSNPDFLRSDRLSDDVVVLYPFSTEELTIIDTALEASAFTIEVYP